MTNKLQSVFWLCLFGFLACWAGECTRGCWDHGSRPKPVDYYGGDRHYSSCMLGRGDHVLVKALEIYDANLAKFSSPPASGASCREVTAALKTLAGVDRPFNGEDAVASQYQFKRVTWEARFVGSDSRDWAEDFAQKLHVPGKRSGLVHFQCSPDHFTDREISADGALIFDTNLDRNDLRQFHVGDLITFEGTVIMYSLGCFYLRGISITNKGNLPGGR